MPINRVVISGFVARSGKLSTSANKTKYLVFGLGFKERRHSPDGEWHTVVNFIDCVVFGEKAVSYFDYVGKGRNLTVDGRLHQNKHAVSTNRAFQLIVDKAEFGPMSADLRLNGGVL